MTLGKFRSSLCQVFVHISVVLCLCLHSFCLRACFSKSDKVFIMWLAKYVPNGDLTRGATETGGCWDLLLCNTRVGQVTTRQPWPPFRVVVAGQDFAFRSLSVPRLLALAGGSWQALLQPLPLPRASSLQKLVQIAAAPGTGLGISVRAAHGAHFSQKGL